MSNELDNGAILPFGLMSTGAQGTLDGFKKTYQNSSLRVGIIKETYGIKDDKNLSKLVPEYDVIVFEQNEDRGSTVITYKNCMAASALGSIADFFEANLRKMKKKTSKGLTPSLGGQNGAVVLILCLDSMSEKGIIVGALTHPDRKTSLVDTDPHLEGEYNGVNIKVEKDGSTTLTFKGATDNDGKITDTSQGPTVMKIEKDGSYQINHKTITQRLDKKGMASLTADDDISNTTKKNFNVTATESINLKATKDLNIDVAKLIAQASGEASLQCQKLTVKADSDINLNGSQISIEAESMASIKATSITLDGLVALGGAGGQPVLILSTMFIGVGNLGIPVISNAIAGFAVKVTAT